MFVVKGKLAETLARFDLGDGGLIPFTIYKADLVTLYPGKFLLLNFGAQKNSILVDKCEDTEKFYVDKNTGQQVWNVNYLNENAEVSFATSALQGPDLWFEPAIYNKIFMTDRLAQALIEIGMGDVFKLQECRIVEGTA